MRANSFVLISGAILILVGLGLIVTQFYLQTTTAQEVVFPTRDVRISAAGVEAGVSTTYVGLALVIVGAFLEAISLVVK